MKKINCLVILLMLSIGMSAQTYEEQEREFRAFLKCFEKMSMPKVHGKEYVLSNGKRVSLLEQTDYKREAFVSADALLERVKKWKESQYMTAVPGRKLLMDGTDLSDWEVNSIRSISNEYFNQGDRAFHIAAHGLVDPGDGSSLSIQMGGQTLNAEETAEVIMQSLDGYHLALNWNSEPYPIVLHCCNSGKGENNFASQLSAALAKHINNVAVIAAPDVVYCAMDENGKYTEYVASDAAIKRNRAAYEKQNWRVFKNGKSYMEGTTDYKGTVKRYINHEKH